MDAAYQKKPHSLEKLTIDFGTTLQYRDSSDHKGLQEFWNTIKTYAGDTLRDVSISATPDSRRDNLDEFEWKNQDALMKGLSSLENVRDFKAHIHPGMDGLNSFVKELFDEESGPLVRWKNLTHLSLILAKCELSAKRIKLLSDKLETDLAALQVLKLDLSGNLFKVGLTDSF